MERDTYVSFLYVNVSRILFLVTSNGLILNEILSRNAKFQNVLKVRKIKSVLQNFAL